MRPVEEPEVAKGRRGEVEEEVAAEADQEALQVPQAAHLQLLRQLTTSPLQPCELYRMAGSKDTVSLPRYACYESFID